MTRPTVDESPATTAAPRAKRGPYRRLPVEQRREQLIAVALELFSRHAPEEVSLDDVAAAAEASRPLVYRYFPGGKQQLYEAALKSAASELIARFVEPAEGSPTERLAHALDRYLSFVHDHAAGYGALLRGGSAVETQRTTAMVDEVRRAAFRSIVQHLEVAEAGPRLGLLIRSWIAVVEATALTSLDEGDLGEPESLRDWLVDEFVAMFAVTALHDAQSADVLKRLLAHYDGAGPGAKLIEGLGGLLA
ncbi:TetR/AcrR family transcriptional regulator [Streptacidiphilus jiangxiensis]|uniref:DNA-binding transcriptional regulator, AcrR family n=1 Tax=Streptacidiphilus jiangxiensis TaxID=235985 RepID=A0A1H7G4U3_STRJI|nr:TetR/AcrR family transcriptional regulator [Streptacidiphilus jiangxiensis]SEK33151.1 DNA-binding transcriptional regulator, AcrR family [Streptacidiphilus jiangxiensis]